MKTFFDASALVPLLNQESPHHASAQDFWRAASARATNSHALEETFRTLTTLKKPLKPSVACQAIEALVPKIETVAGTPEICLEAMRRMTAAGHIGAMIYDALHCVAAGKCQADKIVTRNKKHFDFFAAGIPVAEIT
jgi:predicted nucleic acid-binding protein